MSQGYVTYYQQQECYNLAADGRIHFKFGASYHPGSEMYETFSGSVGEKSGSRNMADLQLIQSSNSLTVFIWINESIAGVILFTRSTLVSLATLF